MNDVLIYALLTRILSMIKKEVLEKKSADTEKKQNEIEV